MASGVITLAEMRAKGITMLEVSCRRCERRGRLRIDRLTAEHGAGVGLADGHRGGLSAHQEPFDFDL